MVETSSREKKQINLRLMPVDYATLEKKAKSKDLSLYAYVAALLEKHASKLRMKK